MHMAYHTASAQGLGASREKLLGNATGITKTKFTDMIYTKP